MYYDMNKIIEEELEGINYLLDALKACEAGPDEGYLVASINEKGTIYSLRKRTAEGKKITTKLGDEKHPEVIKIKQKHFNEMLKKTLEEDRKLLMKIAGKYKCYEPDAIDEAIGAVYCDTTGLVNKNPGMMSDEEWQAMPYESNIDYSFGENPNIAFDGQEVRSKSEIILYNLATMLGIPRHYEEDIGLINEAGQRVYKNADFRFRDKHMKKVALEHMGKLVEERYFINAMHKIRLYILNGFVLNDTLLLTADDCYGKLDSFSVVRMLKARFEIE